MKNVVTEEMVSRFLCWRLPEGFSPDCGISFKRTHSETSPFGPQTHEPTGTNLLTAEQARQMLEYVLATPAREVGAEPEVIQQLAELARGLELPLPLSSPVVLYEIGRAVADQAKGCAKAEAALAELVAANEEFIATQDAPPRQQRIAENRLFAAWAAAQEVLKETAK